MQEAVWKLSACDLVAAIGQRAVSVTEVVTAVVGRLREHNPRINAVVDDMTEQALAIAAEHDKRHTTDAQLPPLFGVPITIKENVDQKGRATPNGVLALKDLIAPDDSPLVKNLLAAGAIVIGRTNTPEFSFRAFTDNPLHGATLNPWDSGRTPGGSSGGAGAASVMGFGPFGHGNDIGGSLRIPAFACGLSTVKPSFGRVPVYLPSATAERPFLASQMSAQGVVARQVEDVRLALSVMIRARSCDPWHIPLPLTGEPLPAPIKVAFTRESYGIEVAPSILSALDSAADMLTEAGYQVEEVRTPSVLELAEQWRSMTFGEMKVMLDTSIRELASDSMQALFDQYYEFSNIVDATGYMRGLAERTRLAREWSEFLDDYPLMLSPFQLNETNPVDADLGGLANLTKVFDALIYSYSFNYLALPAGVTTAGWDSTGMPVGVQLVGRRFREDTVIDALQAIEDRFGVAAHTLWARAAD